MESNRRFFLPLVFAIVGITITILISLILSSGIARINDTFDFITGVEGTVQSDVQSFLYLLLPVQYGVFFILTIPVAFLMMIFTTISRSATYELGIYPTGEGFNGVKMLRRAIVPALFALSTGEIFLNLMPDLIFSIPEIPPVTGGAFLRLFNPLQTLVGALIALVAGLVIFAPTWILNDSGIISQVKPQHMEYRRCPDTEGIGRWFSNLFGGFAILTYPVTMIYRFFYLHLIVHQIPLDVSYILNSLVWIIGIPLLVMSFVMPFVILNELTLKWTGQRMRGFARTLGAKDAKPKSLMLEMMEVKDQLNDPSYDDESESDTTRLTRK